MWRQPTFPYGQTVTLHSRTVVVDADGKPVTDDYGNDVYEDKDTPITNVPVWPRNSSELVQAQDTLITGLWAVLPANDADGAAIDPSAVDEITVYGKRWKVDGEPGDFRQSPLTGHGVGWQVALTRVS